MNSTDATGGPDSPERSSPCPFGAVRSLGRAIRPGSLPVLAATLATAAALLAATPARAQMSAADSAWSAGDRDLAQKLYRRVLQQDSLNSRALLRLGLLEAGDGDYEEGLRLLNTLVEHSPDRADAAIARARVLAWSDRPGEAVESLGAFVERHPEHVDAIAALAQIHTWEGNDDRASELYARAVELAPDDRELRRDHARSLHRTGDRSRAEEIYLELMESSPSDVETRSRLIDLYSGTGRPDRVIELAREQVEHRPAEAHRDLAQAYLAKGDLITAERHWRRAVEADPDWLSSYAGLAQVLRWQGRNAAAIEVLERARRIQPGAAQEQWEWARTRTAPRLTASYAIAGDSDENEIRHLSAGFSFRPAPRLEVSADFGRADHDQVTETFSADGAANQGSLGLWYQLEPGWTLEGSIGQTRIRRPDENELMSYSAGFGTPGRKRIAVDADFSRDVLDYTAIQLREQVVRYEGVLETRIRIGGAWDLNTSASYASYRGEERNRRLGGELFLETSPPGPFTIEFGAEAFGFQKDVNDGYYDPVSYVKGEATLRYDDRVGPLVVQLEASPGYRGRRHEGEETEYDPSITTSGTLGLQLDPGRTLEFSSLYATQDPAVIRAGDVRGDGYDYYSFRLGLSWVF